MLPICQVCLRTDKKLQVIDDTLDDFYDELCDFAACQIQFVTQFCTECAYMLRKFNKFKEKCRLAVRILKSWKKQEPAKKEQLSLLYTQMPQTCLSFSKLENCKVYFYQEEPTVSSLPPVTASPAIAPSNYPQIVIDPSILPTACDTQNNIMSRVVIKQEVEEAEDNDEINDTYDATKCDMETPVNIKIETEVKCEEIKIEFEETERDVKDITAGLGTNSYSIHDFVEREKSTETFSQAHIDFNYDKRDAQLVKPNQNFYGNAAQNINMLSGVAKDMHRDKNDVRRVESSSTDPEYVLKPNLRISDLGNTNISGDKEDKGVNRKRKPELVLLKDWLTCRLSNCGQVKDEHGNVIDLELITNSLDKLTRKVLREMRTMLSGPAVSDLAASDSTTLTPEAIRFLSELHRTCTKKYVDSYSYSTEHLSSKEQVEAEFLKRGQEESYVAAAHKCAMCFRWFNTRKLLDNHMETHHNAAAPHACAVCQVRFESKRACDAHFYKHKLIFRCKLCPLVSNYKTSMEYHSKNIHKGFVYTCTICSKPFKSKSHLCIHRAAAHGSAHSCCACARSLPSAAALLRHTAKKHPGLVTIPENADSTCSLCNVTFINEEVFQKHVGISHGGMINNQHIMFRKHTKNAKRKPNFICRVCNATEHSYTRIMLHYKNEHPTEKYEVNKHICHICGKGYSNITSLNEHKNLHTGAKPFVCEHCYKKFHRKVNLRNHMEHHFPPTRECPLCGKMFITASTLSKHIKSHETQGSHVAASTSWAPSDE